MYSPKWISKTKWGAQPVQSQNLHKLEGIRRSINRKDDYWQDNPQLDESLEQNGL